MQDAMDLLDETLDNAYHACKALAAGCGECDCSFPCYQGAATCIRMPRGSDTYVASAAGANGPGAPL